MRQGWARAGILLGRARVGSQGVRMTEGVTLVKSVCGGLH